MVRKIYLAGAMAGLPYAEQMRIRYAIIAAISLYMAKHDTQYTPLFINPVDYYTFEDNPNEEPSYDSPREVMDFDLDRVRESDLIISDLTYDKSMGTMAEMAISYDRGIPVIGYMEEEKDIHDWQKCFCRRIFTDLEKLAKYVCEFYLN